MSINPPPHEWDLSEAEKDLIRRRAQLRNEMKAKFQKHLTDPYVEALKFDPALQRWSSMKAFSVDHYRPTPRNMLAPLTFFGIFGCLCYSVNKEFNERRRTIGSGQITYLDRENKELHSY
ncbi:hypothetical protein GJ496_011245 [Pomphorhynchus laevis]|nr:hypothetical protein GJ496_011245 [Pomphorhynchus laevis]